MPKQTILDNEYAALWFHEESKIVHHKIHKFMPSGRFQELLTAGAECLERYKATKWLSDDRANTVVSTKAADWGRTIWTPRVVRAGFKYWAIVLPAKVIGQMQMASFIQDQKALGITVRTFSDEADAMKWLESVGSRRRPARTSG